MRRSLLLRAFATDATKASTVTFKHWAGSGIAGLIAVFLVFVLVSRAARLMVSPEGTPYSEALNLKEISSYFTAIISWAVLPFALILLRTALHKGWGGVGTARAIGALLPLLGWLFVGSVTVSVIPFEIIGSVLTGTLIGLATWLILRASVPAAFAASEKQ